jgi:hypothetical protein
VEGKLDDPVYASREGVEDAAPIAEEYPDPIMLLEALSASAGRGRFARNSALQTIVRAYQVSQREIKETQARLDLRLDRREERQEERRAERDRERA